MHNMAKKIKLHKLIREFATASLYLVVSFLVKGIASFFGWPHPLYSVIGLVLRQFFMLKKCGCLDLNVFQLPYE